MIALLRLFQVYAVGCGCMVWLVCLGHVLWLSHGWWDWVAALFVGSVASTVFGGLFAVFGKLVRLSQAASQPAP